jgi:signal transduction histidine kinase
VYILAHDENRIQFNFAPLHFNNMALNECSYMLEGYDKEWIPAGSQRSILYTNLSPGTYRFLVKARNADGTWSREPAALRFEIKPPWWLTWWALLGYLFALAAAIRGYITWRSGKLREEKKILEETVAERTRDLQTSIKNLEATQKQLVQSEKMASLGELTAGIAHEIQNPLNFVNNFAEVNEELLAEASESLDKNDIEDVRDLLVSIRENEGKIRHHGKRADSIVKGMLQHSRTGTGEKELTDINDLVDEYIRLSFHGYRAKDKLFNAQIDTSFDPDAGKVAVIPQDLGRVLLNVFNNAFYAMSKRKQASGDDYASLLTVSTQRKPSEVLIRIRDNGGGIPASIKEKIFNPFFTTKPTGEGTGLGLSLSYEIITRGHGGTMDVHTTEGDSTEFTIRLPIA